VLDYYLLGKLPKAAAKPAPVQEPPAESDAESD